MNIFLTFLFLVSGTNIECRWGAKSSMPPQSSCGIPTWVRFPIPANGKRFEFRRADNPNLSGYFHRKRNGQGQVKRFSNLINLYKVDLFLCPLDFKQGKTLLFKMITKSGIKKYQCRLGGEKLATPKNKKVNDMAGSGSGKSNGSRSPAKIKNPAPNNSVIKKIIPPPEFIPSQNDPFARFLGGIALALAIISMILIVVVYFLLKRSIKYKKE